MGSHLEIQHGCQNNYAKDKIIIPQNIVVAIKILKSKMAAINTYHNTDKSSYILGECF